DRIWDPPVLNGHIIEAQDSIAGPRVSITGLADTAGVDNQALWPQPDRLAAIQCDLRADRALFLGLGCEAKDAWRMGMPYQAKRGGKVIKVDPRCGGVDDILPDRVARAA